MTEIRRFGIASMGTNGVWVPNNYTRRFAHDLPARPASVRAARRAASTLAEAAGAGPEHVARVALAVSEAVSNAVLHAYPPGGEPGDVHVAGCAPQGAELRVEVRDTGLGIRPRADSPGLGLGLPLISQATDRLELERAPLGGTTVRMTFRLA